jgi:hypothetical protein
MAAAEEVVERLAALGLELNRAADLLISPTPEALDQTAALLRAATLELALVRGGLSPGAGLPAKEAARGLRAAAHRASRLLEAAASFFGNWNRHLGAITGGYIPGGEPAAVVRRGHVSLHG